MSAAVVNITTISEIPTTGKTVLFFWAPWHDGCQPLAGVLMALATTVYSQGEVWFGRVDTDMAATVAEQYNVSQIPTIVLSCNGSIVETLEGTIDPSHITLAVQRLANRTTTLPSATTATTTTTTTTTTSTLDPQQALQDRLHRLVHSDTVMLFMKGTPTVPKCGFSRQAVELLQAEQIPFGSFDILTDDTVRQGLKQYSNWPTYPQLYVNGELVGGLDILKELQQEGRPLAEQWKIPKGTSTAEIQEEVSKEALKDRLGKLVRRHDVMVFMKGLPSAPQCGFSRKLIDLLDGQGVSYDAFNILEDEEVRQGLKEYSNWPTYPQLYVKGELVGGLDICEELAESGELKDMLTQ